METKERIVQDAYELFIRFGFRSVSMDDIASKLGMSKKTLYQHFADKDQLVEAVIIRNIAFNENKCLHCVHTATNAIDEIYSVIDTVSEQFKDMNMMILFEMQKFHPMAFKIFKKHKDEFILKTITENIKRGIKEELYRNDLDIAVVSRFRLESMMLIFNAEFLTHTKTYQINELMQIISELFLFGIASPKGYKLIQKNQQQRIKNKK